MRTIVAVVTAACLLGGCGSIVGTTNGDGAARLSSDRRVYAQGDSATVTLRNVGPWPVGYNLCFTARERRTPTGWVRVETLRLCSAELTLLHAGAVAESREHIAAEWIPGEYRFVTHIEVGGKRRAITTESFTVRE